ncbi:MAG: YaiI/YqxD family protein [Bacillota bacterium]
MVKILVDADSCPVKNLITEIANLRQVEVWLVASLAHASPAQPFPFLRQVQVDSFPQAVDLYVANHTNPGDIVITGDFGLAAVVLARRGIPVSPRGLIYHARNIDAMLEQRHMAGRLRRGGCRVKGPRAISKTDRQRLFRVLLCLLDNSQGVKGQEP